jgi:hypothetical protein
MGAIELGASPPRFAVLRPERGALAGHSLSDPPRQPGGGLKAFRSVRLSFWSTGSSSVRVGDIAIVLVSHVLGTTIDGLSVIARCDVEGEPRVWDRSRREAACGGLIGVPDIFLPDLQVARGALDGRRVEHDVRFSMRDWRGFPCITTLLSGRWFAGKCSIKVTPADKLPRRPV